MSGVAALTRAGSCLPTRRTVFPLTKIRMPLERPHTVARSALLERLHAALLSCQVVLVVAPAGYGKTTFLVQGLRQLPEGAAVAWLRADPDDDLHRFLSSLAATLDPYDLPWRVAPEGLGALADGEHGLRRIANELCGALAASGVARGVIAIDDLQAIADPRVLEVLDLTLQSLPETWTLVLASRAEPHLSLARMWAEGQVAEFRQEDLRFTAEEVRELIRATVAPAGAATEGEQVEHLLRDTDGWAAGLCLSLGAVGAGLASARTRLGRRHLFEYLASEVLRDMPAGLQDFLRRCSVLDELTARRCAAVSGDPRAAVWLEEIERRGLFATVLDGPEPTLKLHDLFRSFLEDQLLRLYPDELPQLLQRAAADEQDIAHKVELLLQAGAWPAAEDVLIAIGSTTLSVADRPQLRRLVERFPAGMQERSPALAYLRGLAAWPAQEYVALLANMHAAAEGFEQRGQTQQARKARAYEALALFMAGRVDEGRALSVALRQGPAQTDVETQALGELFDYWYTMVKGPVDGPAAHLSRMTGLLAGAPAELWLRCTPPVTAFVNRPRHSQAVERFVREGFAIAGESHQHLRAALEFLEASLHVAKAEFPLASSLVRRMYEDFGWLALPQARETGIQSVHDVLLGRPGAEQGLRERIGKVLAAPESRPAHMRNGLETMARIAAANGAWEAARQAVRVLEQEGPFPEGPAIAFPTAILRGRFALEDGDARAACELLRPLLATLAQTDRYGADAYVRITLAVAELRCAAVSQAWAALEPAIERAAESGQITALVLPGIELLAELVRADWGDTADRKALAQLAGWLAHFQRLRAGDTTLAPAAGIAAGAGAPQQLERHERHVAEAGVADLTERELEVMRCLAAGDSNKVIARKLDLSPHTVKRHVARILERLDMASRGEAASWYRGRVE